MSFSNKFIGYMKKYRKDLMYADKFSYGRFPDDLFDQHLSSFYESLFKRIAGGDDIKGNKMSFDPNAGLDQAISIEISKQYKGYKKNKAYFKLELFKESFKDNIRKWVLVHLEDDFLRRFKDIKSKFTETSIKKIVEAGMTNMLIDGYFWIGFDWTIETVTEYIDHVVSWFERISLHLIYTIIKGFRRNISYMFSSTFEIKYFSEDKDLLYWMKPEQYFPPLRGKDKVQLVEKMIENLKLVERSDEIPENIIAAEYIQTSIKKFIKGINDENYIIEESRNKSFAASIFDIEYRIMLHFLYFGLVAGKIPGIKDGGYSVRELKQNFVDLFEDHNGNREYTFIKGICFRKLG